MFKNFPSNFFRGLFTLLPLFISVYVILWIFKLADTVTSKILLVFWPEFLYFPGLGAIIGILFIYLFGVLIAHPAVEKGFSLIEGPFKLLPVIKTVYNSIKDFTQYFSSSGNKKNSQVVLVKMPGSDIEMVGLMTRENMDGMPLEFSKDSDKVAVYFPMSYQLGGYTVFIPRAWIRSTDMKVEFAIRSALTAWLPGSSSKE